MTYKTHLYRHRGFTLIELLTVIAVIGILAAILIPTVGAARKAMNKASNRALFTQIANGIEAYRTYYGYYPLSGSKYSKSFKVSDNDDSKRVKCIAFDTDEVDLVDILMGVSNTDNPRQKTFVTFGDGDLDEDNQLIDAFGNTSIGVVIGQEGTIPASAVESLSVKEADTSKSYTYDPGTNVRGKVLIWSVESVSKGSNTTTANFVTYPRMNTESTKQ
jgi:prepilin-type N-terminal cleavage/methylation domain-containing protein